MGVPKKNYIQIEFDCPLPEEYHNAEDLTKALCKYYKEKNPEHQDKPADWPYFCIYDFEAFDEEVQFEVYSDRYQNCDFQVETIRVYTEEKYPDDFVEMYEDPWTQS